MRPADTTETIKWNGLSVIVQTWVDDTDQEWDGDCEIDPNCEGYDVMVAVETAHNGALFTARDSLGSIWVTPDARGRSILDDEILNVRTEALSGLYAELRSVSQGRDIRIAKDAAQAAGELLRTIEKGKP